MSTTKATLQKDDELMIFVRMGFVQFTGKVMAVMDGIWKDHYIIHVTPKDIVNNNNKKKDSTNKVHQTRPSLWNGNTDNKENHKLGLVFNSDEQYIAESKQPTLPNEDGLERIQTIPILKQSQKQPTASTAVKANGPLLATLVATPIPNLMMNPLIRPIPNPNTNINRNNQGIIGSLLSLLKDDTTNNRKATIAVTPKTSSFLDRIAISPSTESESHTDNSRNSSLSTISFMQQYQPNNTNGYGNLMFPLKIPYPMTVSSQNHKQLDIKVNKKVNKDTNNKAKKSTSLNLPSLPPSTSKSSSDNSRKRNISQIEVKSDRNKKKQKRPTFNPLSDKAQSALEYLRATATANNGNVHSLRFFMKEMDLGFVAANNVIKHYAKERGIEIDVFKRTWMTLKDALNMKCNVCYLEFKNKGQYEKHCKSHNNDICVSNNVFRCKFCPKTMENANELFDHYQKLHAKQWHYHSMESK